MEKNVFAGSVDTIPYIKKEQRHTLDMMADAFRLFQDDPIKGRLNYLIFKIVKDELAEKGESYDIYRKIIGELECAKFEIERRLLAKYEDKKIQENGDVE